jgi:hypothetical protein
MNPVIILVWIGISVNPGSKSNNNIHGDVFPSETACKESSFLVNGNRVCIPVATTPEYFAYVEKQHEEKLKNLKNELELKEKLKYEMCMENVPDFIPKDSDNYKVFEFRCNQKVYGNKK